MSESPTILHTIREKPFSEISLVTVLLTANIFLFSGNVFAQTPTTVPDPPTHLVATPISPTSVQLSWSPPQNNGGAPITGYKIEYKTPPSDYYVLATIGNLTQYSQTGLATGKSYIYRVSTINTVGTSSPSTEAVATPTSTSTPPKNILSNPPQSLTATVYSSNQINLSWLPPTQNGGPPLLGYKITYQVDSSNFTNLVSNTGSTSTSYSHIGVQIGHTYSYKVFAVNSVGISSSSNIASAVAIQITTIPSPPRDLTAFPASPTSISLSWSSPVTDGGSTIIGYKIENRTGTLPYSVLVANTGTQQMSYVHTGLATGTSVTYRVSAINSIGTGSPSNEATAAPEQTLTPIISDATATSPTTVSLSWIAPSQTYGESIVGYRIDQIISGSAFNPIIDNTGMVASYTISNLVTGKTYTFTVTALFLGGTQSNPSTQVSVTPTSSSGRSTPTSPLQNNTLQQNQAVPNPPIAVNATLVSHNTIKLSWTPPSNNGKPPVIGYKIEFKTGYVNWSVLVSNTGLETAYFHSELAANTTYTYRVSAINTIGTSTPSNEVSVTTLSTNSTTQTSSLQPRFASGVISVTNTTAAINYNIAGGQVVGAGINPDTFSLQVQLHANSEGILFLQLPRDMIDAKNTDGSDADYIITTDKSLAKFNETKTTSYRTLAIEFPAGGTDIGIYGTKVVPEFPAAPLVFVVAVMCIIFLSTRIIGKIVS